MTENSNWSKTLSKEDDGAGRLIKNLLNGANGYGIDLEIVFNTKSQGYIILEFLKCESKFVTPYTSHPHKYWDKNWKKFVFLYNVAKKLNAQLYLVNYEESNKNEYGLFKTMQVDMTETPSKENKIKITIENYYKNISEFREWYLKINNDYVGVG